MNDLEAENLEMSNTIDKLNQEFKTELGGVETEIDGITSELDNLKTDLDEAKINLDDIQERNHAFKYTLSSGTGAVRQGTRVKFNSRSYGSGVSNGVFTAPIGKNLIY